MEEHPDIAKGFSRGDRVKQDELWSDLVSRLNSCGPPTRDITMWKKTWCDWRRSIKTRLAENKAFIKKTGGGDFQQHYLSPIEEQLAIICEIFQAVEGVTLAKSFGGETKQKENFNEKASVDLPSTSSSTPSITNKVSPKRKRKCLSKDIIDVMEEEKNNFENVATKISEVNEALKNQAGYLKHLNRNIDELRSLKKKELEEIKRHHSKMERIATERNELKLEFLKIEKFKMGFLE